MTPLPVVSETVRKHKEYLFPAVATYYQEPLALVRGEGMYVWDDRGDKYLDCFGGVLTVSVGHCHPDVSDAVARQVHTLQHTSTLYANAPQSDLAEKLAGDRAGPPQEVLLHQQRHRGRRHGHHRRQDVHRAARDRRPAPLLQRPVGHRPLRHRPRPLAPPARPGRRHRPRPRPLLLPLPVQDDLPRVRPGLRRRHRGGHPDHDHRRDRRLHGRDDPGRRRLHRPAARLLRARRRDRPPARRPVHRRRGADRLGPNRATPGSASSTGTSSRTS